MALKRWKLIEAREKAGLSQEELAEELETTRVSISHWENAVTKPHPHFKRKLEVRFGIDRKILLMVTDEPDETAEALGEETGESVIRDSSLEEATKTGDALPVTATPTSAPVTSCVWQPPTPTIQNYIASNPARLFWQIAHTDYSNPDEMTADIQAAIKDMDMITRRDALMELASIPMISLGKQQTLKANRYEEMLRSCAAALNGCWELYRGVDPQGAMHAFECCCTYIPLLETIASNKPSLHKEALRLATQYALLQTMLAWNYKSTQEAVTYGQNALSLSLETRDMQLQMSARTKLSWSLIVDQQCIRALSVMQEGEHTLKNYQQRGLGSSLHPGMVGNFYSSYAIAQVENGIDPDRALGVATESPPLDSHIAFVEFTTSTQCLEIARIYSTTGNYQQTLNWIERRVDPQTLAPRIQQSESGRIQSIGLVTSAYLQSPDRDMTEIIRTWKVSMEGAKTRTIEDSYRRAMNNLAIMRHLWPKEQAIRKLMPLTSHW